VGRLKGKKAVVCGTGGIGRAVCRSFCEEGAAVIGLDIAADAGLALEKELKKEGFDFRFMRCDVSSEKDISLSSRYAQETFGGVDVLFNNVGIISAKTIQEITVGEWDHVFDVNLKSVFLMTKYFTPLMKGRRGSIINVSSALGTISYPKMALYSSTKAGVIMFSKVMAAELAPDIRVNCIVPGVIETPMLEGYAKEFTPIEQEETFKFFLNKHLLKRFGRPEEVAPLVVYLASDEASFMTGAAIPIDGGASAS